MKNILKIVLLKDKILSNYYVLAIRFKSCTKVVSSKKYGQI